MVTISPLDSPQVTNAGALVARQQAAAAAEAPTVPRDLASPDAAAAHLRDLLESGHTGRIASDGGDLVGVLLGKAEDGPAAELPAAGFAIDPTYPDPSQVLSELYAELAPHLIEKGAVRHYLGHVATTSLTRAATDVGFARTSYCAIRPVDAESPRGAASSSITVRLGAPNDLETIVRLCQVEIGYRYVPPVYSRRPPRERSVEELMASHADKIERGGAHIIASVDGEDVGLLTLDATMFERALCPEGQPWIGETATVPAARGHGVGTAMVEAAMAWAAEQGHRGVTVSFQPANRVSRRFWLGSGFVPTGFWTLREIPESYAGPRVTG